MLSHSWKLPTYEIEVPFTFVESRIINPKMIEENFLSPRSDWFAKDLTFINQPLRIRNTCQKLIALTSPCKKSKLFSNMIKEKEKLKGVAMSLKLQQDKESSQVNGD